MIRNSLIRHSLTIGLALLISACSYLSPYKIDIQQGNIVPQENVEKLKTGMTRAEVKNLLGTPLVSDIYHADRWDYFYSLRKGWTVEDQRKLTLTFEKDVLAKIEGQGVPNAEMSLKK